MNIKELNLLEEKEVREKFISRVEVLEKVKQLILLPNTDFATVEQAARYYEVEEKTIQTIVDRNMQELKENGYMKFKQNEIITKLERNPQVVETVNTQWYKEVKFKNGMKLKINNAGIRLFTRRTILNVGMLLRDSKIAKEIRTYLLNIEENSTDDQKDIEIKRLNEEDKILLKAINSKNKMEMAIVLNEYKKYKDNEKNKEVKKKEIKIEALADGILRWDKRDAINRMVRKIANKIFKMKGTYRYVAAYDKLKGELLYKYSIHITKRLENLNKKNATMFDVLDEDELTLAVKSSVALCEMYGIDTSDILYKK